MTVVVESRGGTDAAQLAARSDLGQRARRGTGVAGDFDHVVDGRFKGGHITRHYGRPLERLHAVQMEMGWHCYSDDKTQPPTWSDARAGAAQVLLRQLVETMIAWQPA